MPSDLPHSRLTTLGQMGIKQGINFGGALPAASLVTPDAAVSRMSGKKCWWILAIASDGALAKAELTFSFCHNALSAGKHPLDDAWD